MTTIWHGILKNEFQPSKWGHPEKRLFGHFFFQKTASGKVFPGKFESGNNLKYKVNTLSPLFVSERPTKYPFTQFHILQLSFIPLCHECYQCDNILHFNCLQLVKINTLQQLNVTAMIYQYKPYKYLFNSFPLSPLTMLTLSSSSLSYLLHQSHSHSTNLTHHLKTNHNCKSYHHSYDDHWTPDVSTNPATQCPYYESNNSQASYKDHRRLRW